MDLPSDFRLRAEAMLGKRILRWEPRTAGLTNSAAGVATVAGGRTVFLKAATDQHSAAEVTREMAALQRIKGSFVPELLVYDEGDQPMLALEDLSHGHWPEPYPADLAGLQRALEELRTTALPPDLALESFDSRHPDRPVDLAALAIVGAPPLVEWITEHEAEIKRLADDASGGSALVHGDLWYSNICILPDRVVFVDWSHAFIGSPWHDASTVSIDLVIGGRRPVAGDEGLPWAAAYLIWSIGALASGPGAAISNAAAWRTDVEELVDGVAWWVAHELGLATPPQLSERSVGWT